MSVGSGRRGSLREMAVRQITQGAGDLDKLYSNSTSEENLHENKGVKVKLFGMDAFHVHLAPPNWLSD